MKKNCPKRKERQKKREEKDETSLEATLVDDGDVILTTTSHEGSD